MLPLYEKQKNLVQKPRLIYCLMFGLVFGLVYYAIMAFSNMMPSCMSLAGTHNPDSLCPIVEKLDPNEYVNCNDTISRILHDPEFKKKSVQKLANAVKIPTEIYDDTIDPGITETKEDLYQIEPLWQEYELFHQYLEKTFPLVHKHLKIDKINKFALVYTYEGSDSNLKPLMLAAHMDVVPVQRETIGQWTHGPFDGVFDGEYLYGRGVSDCKNLLIALLETIEIFLEEGKFNPKRTIILAFGYDEEASGNGAAEISRFLNQRYGENSMYAIIDEGNEGYVTNEGINFILPATGEKGHLNSIIELYTPGGHSSVPPNHTSIGIISKLIDIIEETQFDSVLTQSNPVLNQLQCVAEHSKTVDKSLKSQILQAQFNPFANKAVRDYISDSETKYLIATSQAADIIQGGAKSNALPEHVSVVVNHRIAMEESVSSTAKKILGNIEKIATKFDLGIIYEGQIYKELTTKGYFNYTLNEPLEPSPVSPANDKIWQTFGGSVRYLFEDLVFANSSKSFIPAPYISMGNTDTKSYWNLTQHIYRYVPSHSGGQNIHSVDEKLDFNAHLEIIAFYYYYIQVVDQMDDTLV